MSSPSSAGSSPRLAPPPPQNETGDAPPPPQDEGEQALDSSFFPSPSHFYKRYTSANLALPPSAFLPPIPGEIEPDSVKREELEPPNVDWVVERGSYAVFGETWPVEEVSPTLEEMGVTEMFNRGEDRTTSLLTLLRTMLVTYTTLISSLLAPPPSITVPQPAEPPDPERLVNHIRLISINMHFLVNELRPGQARETLRNLLRSQIDRRRAKTAAIRARCAELKETLASLQSDLAEQVAAVAPEDKTREKEVIQTEGSDGVTLVGETFRTAAE